MVGEIGKLYVLLDDHLDIKIKVLNYADSMTNLTVQSSISEDFEMSSDTEFLQAFARAKFMPSGCLIVDDWRMAKISQTSMNKPAIFQSYYNFLPDEDMNSSSEGEDIKDR